MRETLTGIETQIDSGIGATTASGNPEDRVHMFAVYGALAVIAAIVFGTLSYHPF